ncbi:MAG TPA: serine hydroxymethyltransferase [Solirubrobacteraceae bacterium]
MTELPPDFFNRPLAEVDPQIADVLARELERQQRTLEMIASENFVPRAVLECQGSVLTNKYAEGYPGKRYYGGCEFVDVAEELAISRAKELFGAEHANVQPHAGAQTNTAVYQALLEPGDTLMGLSLAHGGHLTHGMRLNVSGKLYDIVAYEVSPETHLLDMDEVERLAREHRPKMIVAGWSAYPRFQDFARFREIADAVGAYLLVDMAHFAGLVAAGLHPSPVPHADVVTTTIHKTLGGARGGMILCREEYAKKINSAVFPGQQGGPLMHVIAGKAVALGIAQTEPFRERQRRTVAGAQAVSDALLEAGHGVSVVTGGTDVHLVLVDLRDAELDGRQAEDRLHEIGITVNRNAVPFDPRPPMVTSGLRVGTSALATRGLQTEDFAQIGQIIATALTPAYEAQKAELAERAAQIADRHPLYEHLGTPAAV